MLFVRRCSVDDSHILENTGGILSKNNSNSSNTGLNDNRLNTIKESGSGGKDGKRPNPLSKTPNIHQIIDQNMDNLTNNSTTCPVKRHINRKKSITSLINGENINHLPDISMMIGLPTTKQAPTAGPTDKTSFGGLDNNFLSQEDAKKNVNFFREKQLESVEARKKRFSVNKVNYSGAQWCVVNTS